MIDLMPTPTPPPRRRPERWLVPALATGLVHGAAVLMLWHSWSPEAPPSAPQTVMITQLVTLPVPEPEPASVPESLPEPEPVVEVEPPEPPIDRGEIARKRLEDQQQREREEQQRLARQQLEQQQQREREEQARREQREQELAAQRAHEEQQRLAAQAQARALAEADAARQAAEAAAIAQYQPISKKPPAYPRRALDRALEGDCTVIYTVTREGRVKDPQIVDGACDDPLFERPSLNAATSFRYQPRLINGQPVDVPGIRNTFRYRIQ